MNITITTTTIITLTVITLNIISFKFPWFPRYLQRGYFHIRFSGVDLCNISPKNPTMDGNRLAIFNVASLKLLFLLVYHTTVLIDIYLND